ncbi:hypothetical protein DPEC_G00062030 [Dallia pectoralis]|uniref:Uncharacterized protein n=1 Tax=Dallia pectoralis TaxID=75939 RepID=A0ACC2H7S2_DALPE|nr:hypothetical protein DPEC_G00062030 [Dallia pectoralis]
MGFGPIRCGISARTSNSGSSKNSRTSGCRTAASRISAGAGSGSGTGNSSFNSSRYFGSVDSSQNSSQKGKGHSSRSVGEVLPMELEPTIQVCSAGAAMVGHRQHRRQGESILIGQFRDIDTVLREDRERIRAMQKSQPCFTGEQRKELVEVHQWCQKYTLLSLK